LGLRRARGLGLSERGRYWKVFESVVQVVDPCLADRLSAHTETCMEKKAQEI